MTEFTNILVTADDSLDVPNLYEEDVETLSALVAQGWEIKTCTHFKDNNGKNQFLVLLTISGN
jgi:hypothetical protein